MFKRILLFVALAFGQSLPLAAQTATVDQLLQELESVHTFTGVTISPDGHWVAWVEGSEIYLLTEPTRGQAHAHHGGRWRDRPP